MRYDNAQCPQYPDYEAFDEKMREIAAIAFCDPERGHRLADQLICKTLRTLGYDYGIDLFVAMDKWYA